MYVADVTDMAELRELLSEAEQRLANACGEPAYEQAAWDIEDITNRMEEIK